MARLVTVRFASTGGRAVRLWLPVLPIVIILSPLIAVATLIGLVACLAYRTNPFRVFAAWWRVLAALTGTRINFEQGNGAVFVEFR